MGPTGKKRIIAMNLGGVAQKEKLRGEMKDIWDKVCNRRLFLLSVLVSIEILNNKRFFLSILSWSCLTRDSRRRV